MLAHLLINILKKRHIFSYSHIFSYRTLSHHLEEIAQASDIVDGPNIKATIFILFPPYIERFVNKNEQVWRVANSQWNFHQSIIFTFPSCT